MVSNPPNGIKYEYFEIDGVRYPVEDDQIDLTRHDETCSCTEHNQFCHCSGECPCYRFGIHDYHGRFDCKPIDLFKHTPPNALPIKVTPYAGANYFPLANDGFKPVGVIGSGDPIPCPCFIQPVIEDEFDSNELGAQWDSANLT